MRTFATVDLPERVSADPALGRLGPVLARFPLHAVHLVSAGTGQGVEEGALLVDRSVDGGTAAFVAEVAVADGPGIADGPAIAILAALLDLEPVAAVGTASRPGWADRVRSVRDLLRTVRPHVGDPEAMLGAAGDGAVAQLTGVLAQAAVRRTPVLLDASASVVAAALLAERLAPGAAAWWIAAAAPASPAARAGLTELGLEPLLDLGVERAGAQLALALLQAAARA